MCWARSFFSRMIDAQLATGATHDMRIFTGSALLAEPAPNRPSAHTPASASFRKRIVSSQFRRACASDVASFASRTRKIVGGPTDFGKPAESRRFTRHTVHAYGRGRLAGFLVPDQQPAAQQRHRLDQHVADHGDLDDAGEHAGGIGEARGRHHGAAEAVAAHQHLGHHGDDQRQRQRHLKPGHDLRQRRRQHDLRQQFAIGRAHVARRPDQLALDALDGDDGRRNHREDGVDHDHGDLGYVVDAEPQDDHRQERDLRHRKADRDDRIEEPVGDERCATSPCR